MTYARLYVVCSRSSSVATFDEAALTAIYLLDSDGPLYVWTDSRKKAKDLVGSQLGFRLHLEGGTKALEDGYHEMLTSGKESFGDPEFYPGFMARFEELLETVSTDR